jgi:hypothetical protein
MVNILTEFLPLVEIDQMGDKRAVWMLSGRLPLREIAAGKRACRAGWRNRGFFTEDEDPDESFDMLAVCASPDGELLLSIESAQFLEEGGLFCNIEDLLAQDWYLEVGEMEEGKEDDYTSSP